MTYTLGIRANVRTFLAADFSFRRVEADIHLGRNIGQSGLSTGIRCATHERRV